MRRSWLAALSSLLLLSLSSHVVAVAEAKPHPVAIPTESTGDSAPVETNEPCQIKSPNTGSFFDLNPIKVVLPPEDADEKKSFYSNWGSEEIRNISWHARGYDYGTNFTVNFCAPVVEDIQHVEDVDRYQWKDVAAYYTFDDKVYSIGASNPDLTFRGRKMTLNYTGGSFCPDDPDIHHKRRPEDAPPLRQRRKSTLISLLCERDPLATTKVTVSFVGTIDECTYFFEARTKAACPAINVTKQQVGPSGLFGLIFGIAIMVYIVGGVVYQRAVLHQRGWRQLPNYNLWAAIATFIKDVILICFSTCIQCVSSGNGDSKFRGNYGQMPNGSAGSNGGSGGLNGYANGPSSTSAPYGSTGARGAGGGGLSRNSHGSPHDDESILIDQLDEVWDD